MTPTSYTASNNIADARESDSPELVEIRQRFDYCKNYWAEIRKQGALDMKCVAGDPWPEKERKARENAERLCLSLDEINQYLNQCINGVRQNKRAIKVIPEGNGADDESAEIRAGIIRGIEYKCKAQSAYIRAFENAVQRSYGYVKVMADYESPRSENQVLKICPVPNPDTIYLDPDAKEADFSDMRYAFELDTLPERTYVENYPKAEIRSFSPEHMTQAPGWILPGDSGYRIQIASYWKVRSKKRTLIYMPSGKGVFLDELPGAKLKEMEIPGLGKTTMVELPTGEVLQAHGHRDSKDNSVCQYITNGLEILEKREWAGKSIPIVPCFGKELWVDEGGTSKRMFISLVRMAREPLLMYCYAATAQTEIAGQASRLLYIGYEGQFDTQTPWTQINKTMLAYAEVKAKTTEGGEAILPLPTKANWEPPIQALEILKQGARQAVQSAMGVSGGLLNGRRGQDRSAKSGIALQELDKQADEGTFHFVDSYDLMIQQVGRICDEMLDTIYDMPRDVVMMGKDDKPSVLSINQQTKHPKTGKNVNFQVKSGDHGVTISVGPPAQSQHQQAMDFAAELAGSPQLVVASISGNETAAKLFALAIRLRQLGPLGDEMADILSPPESPNGEQPLPPEVQKQIQALEQKAAQLEAFAKQQFEEIQTKKHELENARLLKEMDLTAKDEETDKNLNFKREELQTKTELEKLKLGLTQDITELKESLAQIKAERGLAAQEQGRREEQAHASEQGEAARQHEAVEAERERLAQDQQAEAGREHEAVMAETGHAQALEQAEQAAELAPEPKGPGK